MRSIGPALQLILPCFVVGQARRLQSGPDIMLAPWIREFPVKSAFTRFDGATPQSFVAASADPEVTKD
jgi:hypothetical protein